MRKKPKIDKEALLSDMSGLLKRMVERPAGPIARLPPRSMKLAAADLDTNATLQTFVDEVLNFRDARKAAIMQYFENNFIQTPRDLRYVEKANIQLPLGLSGPLLAAIEAVQAQHPDFFD